MSTTIRARFLPHYHAVAAAARSEFVRLLDLATLSDVAAAEVWYADARAFAQSLTVIRPAWSLLTAASIVSAFSPRVTWGHNKAKALQYAQGITPKGLKSHVRAADRCADANGNALRGLKTRAFADAIAGNPDAVVVDVWMCRAAKLGKDAPNVTEYRAIADTITDMARERGMAPATLQALLWIIVRGKAE